jgi:hypothetical protein
MTAHESQTEPYSIVMLTREIATHGLYITLFERLSNFQVVAHQYDESAKYEQAEALIQEHQPDLVFIHSFQLQQADEVAKRIRKLPSNPYILGYVIAQPEEKVVTELDHVFYMPIVISTLPSTIDHLLNFKTNNT